MPTTVTYPNCPCCGSGSGSGSGSSGVTTSCCANPMPTTLYLTGGGGLSGVVAVPLLYVGLRSAGDAGGPLIFETWIASGSFSCGYTKFVFQCISTNYQLTFWEGAVTRRNDAVAPTTCSPFLATISTFGFPLGSCGFVAFSWTVTE